MISPRNFLARSTAKALFPTAVGPTMIRIFFWLLTNFNPEQNEDHQQGQDN
jgi:hypothetical protein